MKICYPVENNNGLESTICGHFGSAPGFLIVDSENDEIKVIANNNQHHAHGMCQPLKALGGEQVDAIVVGGIGAGALNRLKAMGIVVYQASASTVQENMTLFGEGKLPETQASCGHNHGGGCNH